MEIGHSWLCSFWIYRRNNTLSWRCEFYEVDKVLLINWETRKISFRAVGRRPHFSFLAFRKACVLSRYELDEFRRIVIFSAHVAATFDFSCLCFLLYRNIKFLSFHLHHIPTNQIFQSSYKVHSRHLVSCWVFTSVFFFYLHVVLTPFSSASRDDCLYDLTCFFSLCFCVFEILIWYLQCSAVFFYRGMRNLYSQHVKGTV